MVLYDEGHLNAHTTSGGDKPFADLISNDGYTVRVATGPLTTRSLDGVHVLVVVLPRGSNDSNDNSAFVDAEIDVIERWIEGGGSRLLITDHWPYGPAAASLAERFRVNWEGG